MTGHGNHTTYKIGDLGDGLLIKGSWEAIFRVTDKYNCETCGSGDFGKWGLIKQIYLFISLSIYLFIYLFFYLFI